MLIFPNDYSFNSDHYDRKASDNADSNLRIQKIPDVCRMRLDYGEIKRHISNVSQFPGINRQIKFYLSFPDTKILCLSHEKVFIDQTCIKNILLIIH